MVIGDREFVYKYTLQEGEIGVQEGETSECGSRKYVQFEGREEPVKCPLSRDFGRVWSDGKTLWMADRNDEQARKIFVAYGVGRILELQKEIDELNDMVAFVRQYEFKGNSKCFNDNVDRGSGDIVVDGFKKKPKTKKRTEERVEYERRYKAGWDASDFADAKSYIERKIDMLKNEMYIPVSDEEVRHLKRLDSQSTIDAAVRSIIDRHW